MLNNCLLTGNLGADPEVFYSSEGDPIATFNLAFRSSKKKTNWIKITCFNKLAEITEKYLHKGARIGIIGTLDQQKWETDEGFQRSNFQLSPIPLSSSRRTDADLKMIRETTCLFETINN